MVTTGLGVSIKDWTLLYTAAADETVLVALGGVGIGSVASAAATPNAAHYGIPIQYPTVIAYRMVAGEKLYGRSNCSETVNILVT